MRNTLGGLAAMAIGALVLVLSPHIAAGSGHAALLLIVLGMAALFAGVFGEARSLHASAAGLPNVSRDALVVTPSHRVYRMMKWGGLAAALSCLIVGVPFPSLGHGIFTAIMLAMALLFGRFWWYGRWGLTADNRLVADAHTVRFGTLRGECSLPMTDIEEFAAVKAGAATRIGYRVRDASIHRSRWRSLHGGYDGYLPIGYQGDDAAVLSATLLAHR